MDGYPIEYTNLKNGEASVGPKREEIEDKYGQEANVEVEKRRQVEFWMDGKLLVNERF